MNHKLGAHLSAAGGYYNGLKKIQEIGGNTLQIFASSPRGWKFNIPTDESIQKFLDLKKQLGIDPVYFHASYLINLANEGAAAENSIHSLITNLELAGQMQVKGIIVHTGSFKKDEMYTNPAKYPYPDFDPYANVVINIKNVLEHTPKETLFIIENAGNKKIGKDLAEISILISAINDARVRVCIDTCHAYSAGYDVSSPEKLDTFIQAFDSLIGLEKLELIHFNDSKDPFNSGRDRHENIGKGTLGIETFQLMLNHPKLKHLPFIMEVPGMDDKGPDKANMDVLKTLIR